jgi:hypothetical protein
MSLRVGFQIQRERHNDCSEEEKQANEERLARKKEEEQKQMRAKGIASRKHLRRRICGLSHCNVTNHIKCIKYNWSIIM